MSINIQPVESQLNAEGRTALLAHLRARVCEQERKASAELLNKIAKSEHERGELRHARQVLDQQVYQEQHLHDQLVEARVQHFRERELMLDLRMQNDQLRVQELDDRRRIQHLLELAREQERLRQPNVQEITFFRDCRPSNVTNDEANSNDTARKQFGPVTTKPGPKSTAAVQAVTVNAAQPSLKPFGRHTQRRAKNRNEMSNQSTRLTVSALAIAKSKNGASERISNQGARTSREYGHTNKPKESFHWNEGGGSHAGGSGEGQSVIRTIHLPNDRLDSLVETIEGLECELAKQKEENAKRILAVEESRFKCGDPTAKWAVLHKLKKQMSNKADELDKQQGVLADVCTSLVETHIYSRTRTRHLVEENEMLSYQSEKMLEQLKETEPNCVRQVKEEREQVTKNAQEDIKRLTHNTYESTRQVARVRREYDSKMSQWDARTRQLQKTRDELKQRLRALKQRQRFDLEGFENDVSTLEGEMKFVQNAIENGPCARARGNERHKTPGKHISTPVVNVPSIPGSSKRAGLSNDPRTPSHRENDSKSRDMGDNRNIARGGTVNKDKKKQEKTLGNARQVTTREELDRRISDLLESVAVVLHSEEA